MWLWTPYGLTEEVGGMLKQRFDALSFEDQPDHKANKVKQAQDLEVETKEFLDNAAKHAEEIEKYEHDHEHHNSYEKEEAHDSTRGDVELQRGLVVPIPKQAIPTNVSPVPYRPSASQLSQLAEQLRVAFKRPGMFDEDQNQEALHEPPKIRRVRKIRGNN